MYIRMYVCIVWSEAYSVRHSGIGKVELTCIGHFVDVAIILLQVAMFLFPRQLLPLVSSLEHNEYFEGIEQKENELSPDLVNALANVLQNQYRHGFKKLTLNNVGLKRYVRMYSTYMCTQHSPCVRRVKC